FDTTSVCYSSAFVLLLHRRRPHNSTLFPYTTLFRSKLARKSLKVWSNTPFKKRAAAMKKIADDLHKNREKIGKLVTMEMGKTYKDRKSTRLNSSHVKISYAVFCLKKNKASTIFTLPM